MQQEKTPEQSTTSSNNHTLCLLLWAICLAILAMVAFFSAQKTKLPKQYLVKRYGVDKKTFNKWLEHFCPDIVPDIAAYKQRRTVSILEYLLITARLGNPETHPVLTKKDIIEQGEGSYHSLRGCVKGYTVQFGLPSFGAYLSLKKFPPNIGHKMMDQFA